MLKISFILMRKREIESFFSLQRNIFCSTSNNDSDFQALFRICDVYFIRLETRLTFSELQSFFGPKKSLNSRVISKIQVEMQNIVDVVCTKKNNVFFF